MEKIYTLGTSKRGLNEFLEILKFYQVQTVIDVRRWPSSKYFPHFKKENLEKILKENNIEYFHFEKLGGYRQGGYEEYLKTREFKEGLRELIKVAKKKPTVIICAEKLPWKCHRAIIARELEKKRFEIIHIIDKQKVWQPKKEPKEISPLCQKMKEGEFEKLVRQSLLELPEKIRQKIENLAICVEKEPRPEQLRKTGIRYGRFLLGLYEGVPQTKWGRGFGMILPDKITIFQESIEKLAKTPEEIKELVKNTVWHEVAHHFGFDEKGVKELETKGKRKTNL